MGKTLDVVAMLACVLGGLILLTLQSAGSPTYSLTGHTVYEGIAHGIGIYCIGKGLFVARSTHLADESARALRKLVELGGLRHSRETGAEPRKGSD